jgi:hypothetical protein
MKTFIFALILGGSLSASAEIQNYSTILASCDHGTAVLSTDPLNPQYARLVLAPAIGRLIVDASDEKTTVTDNQGNRRVVARGIPPTLSLSEEGSRLIVIKNLIKQTISNSYATGGSAGASIEFKQGGADLTIRNGKMFGSSTTASWKVTTISFQRCQ